MALGLSPQEIIEKGEYQLLAKASHWERVLLANVADVQNGFAFKSQLFDRHEGVPLIRIRDISRCETEDRYKGEYDDPYLVHRDDILVGMDGDFIASYWKGDKALLNQRVCKLVVRSKNFDAKFFFLCPQPFLSAINAETSSVTVKHLSSRTIETIPLPLPPLNEQRRIVAEIETIFSELDNGVESLKTAQEQLQVYRQAVLKHAFEGKATTQWREENKGKLESGSRLIARIKKERAACYQAKILAWNAAPDENGGKPRLPKTFAPLDAQEFNELPSLPHSWIWEKLGWMTCGVEYGTAAKSSESVSVPVLRMGNIQNAKFDWSDLVYTPPAFGEPLERGGVL
jgi:type I restriction enzyme S subunit